MLPFFSKVILLYFVILALLFFFQRNMMYFPQYGKYNIDEIPEGFQEILIETEDGINIKGWLHKKNFKTKKTVLYFHGNAGSINNRINRLLEFAKMDVNFLIISYRGYSGSDGKPNESGLYDDARSAVKFLNQSDVKNSNIFLYGESIGTAVVMEIAQNKDFAGLILEAPFTSIVDIAKKLYYIFPVSYLILDKYNSAEKVQNIKSPILVIHGKNDDLVPFEMGKKIIELAKTPKEILETSDGHVIEYNDKVIKKIRQFLSQ
jgi:uncharacterized protein